MAQYQKMNNFNDALVFMENQHGITIGARFINELYNYEASSKWHYLLLITIALDGDVSGADELYLIWLRDITCSNVHNFPLVLLYSQEDIKTMVTRSNSFNNTKYVLYLIESNEAIKSIFYHKKDDSTWN
jgi:hypothetical protein